MTLNEYIAELTALAPEYGNQRVGVLDTATNFYRVPDATAGDAGTLISPSENALMFD